MNKLNACFIALLISLCVTPNLSAKRDIKTPSDIAEFFSARLAGDTSTIYKNKNRISPRDIASTRDMVWQQWVLANTDAADTLPSTNAFPQLTDHKWDIPSSLEPNAVMPYRFGYKGKIDSIASPLYIFLHGSGHKQHEWAAVTQLATMFDDAPCLYFIPQIPNEGEWYRWYQRGKQWAWEKLLREALIREDVDPNLIYLMGISEGAYGSQRLASFYADYLAGAGPMAGGEPLINAPAENLRNTSFILRTGQKDFGFYRNVLTYTTGEKLDSLQALYPGYYNHQIEIIPDYGHAIDYRPTPLWLRGQKRNPYPKSVYWEDFAMDGRHRNGFYNIYVEERETLPDSVRTCYEMNINGNEVDINVSTVNYTPSIVGNDFGFPIAVDFVKTYTPATSGCFTVYLNDQLVDLNNKVTIKVNGKEIYNGKLTPNLADMVNSCARYFDPTRIYPASLTIDLADLSVAQSSNR